MSKYSFAIIGGGPAGFYMAKLLSRHPYQPIVHIYEKQLTPFGLLRYGVAPDHASIKKAENKLAEVNNYPLFKYFGNTLVDGDMFAQLRKNYSGVIYALGAADDKTLGYEDFPARKLIYWYNSFPHSPKVHLQGIRDVVLVGNGNVSIDVARVLLKDPKFLSRTDINLEALQELKRSSVKSISIVGRRGLVQSSFSLKQARQLKNGGYQILMLRSELEQSLNKESQIQATMDPISHRLSTMRANMRKLAFLSQNCTVCQTEPDLQVELKKETKKVVFRFLLQPIGRLGAYVQFKRTKLTGQPFNQSAESTDLHTQIKADLLISSLGFKCKPLIKQHFEHKNSVINNANGCVVANEKVQIGVYATGWAKTGAVGVIDTTLLNCEESYNNLRIHMEEGVLEPRPGTPIVHPNQISFQDYLRIKNEEFRRGEESGRDRIKMPSQQILTYLNKRVQ